MIVWWSFGSSKDFHPSALMASPSPSGRAAPSAFGSPHYATDKDFALIIAPPKGYYSAAILRFVACVILLLAIISQGLFWIPVIGMGWSLGVTGTVCLLAFIATNLDFYFWKIRRAHDIGRPWYYALLQEGVFLTTVGAILAVLAYASLPPIATFLVGLLPLLVGAWATARSFTWIAGQSGDEGPNAYGDPPEPLPAPR